MTAQNDPVAPPPLPPFVPNRRRSAPRKRSNDPLTTIHGLMIAATAIWLFFGLYRTASIYSIGTTDLLTGERDHIGIEPAIMFGFLLPTAPFAIAMVVLFIARMMVKEKRH